MNLNAYIFFDGNCEEAFRYYENALGGKITMKSTYGESPSGMPIPPGSESKIIHIRLEVGSDVLMGSDDCTGDFKRPQGFSLAIALQDAAGADRIFNALADGGAVTMPLTKTFFAEKFGMCTDRFGINWMVNAGPNM